MLRHDEQFPSQSQKYSSFIEWVIKDRWAAMPPCASASPAVVYRSQSADEGQFVRRGWRPAASGIARYGSFDCPVLGAVRRKPGSTGVKRLVCLTLGRIR